MTQTVLYGALDTEVAAAATDGDRLWIPLDDLERSTGWTAKPEGLCRGAVCVPVPAARQADWLDGGRLDVAAFAAHLGHAVARDEAHAVWSFGPPAGAPSPPSREPITAPDLRLPDLDGNLHSLADYRGKKVLLYSWASW
jgi:hypothetical protein